MKSKTGAERSRAVHWQSEVRQTTKPLDVWAAFLLHHAEGGGSITVETRWDENAGLRRDAISSQVIDARRNEIEETGNEKD